MKKCTTVNALVDERTGRVHKLLLANLGQFALSALAAFRILTATNSNHSASTFFSVFPVLTVLSAMLTQLLFLIRFFMDIVVIGVSSTVAQRLLVAVLVFTTSQQDGSGPMFEQLKILIDLIVLIPKHLRDHPSVSRSSLFADQPAKWTLPRPMIHWPHPAIFEQPLVVPCWKVWKVWQLNASLISGYSKEHPRTSCPVSPAEETWRWSILRALRRGKQPEIARQKRKLPQGRTRIKGAQPHSKPQKTLPVKECICSSFAHSRVNIGLGLAEALLLWLKRSARTEDNSTCGRLRCWTCRRRVDSGQVGSRSKEAAILVLIALSFGSTVGSTAAWCGGST